MGKKLQNLLYKLRDELKTIYGERLLDVVLFGSYARNDAEISSDIDILVVLSGEVDAAKEIKVCSEAISGLSLANDTVISCIFIDKKNYVEKNGPLMRNIRKEGIKIG